MKLSIAILAHNEEKLIGVTLDTVSFADEIVVVDAESTDSTVTICKEHGAIILSRPNIPMLNTNKNVAMDACNGDWILLLDADERVSPEGRDEMLRVMSEGKYDAFLLPRLNFILGRGMRFGGVYPDYQLRLFRRGLYRFEEKHIHERMVGNGKLGILKKPLLHESYPTADTLIQKLKLNARFEADYAWERGLRPGAGLAWKWLFWLPFIRTLERYFLKLGFLNGFAGVASTVFDCMNFVMRYLYLVEKGREGKKEEKP